MKNIGGNTSAYDAALKIIARRDMSESAMRASLKKAGYSGNDIEPAIKRLIELKLIDDFKCARRIVELHLNAERGRLAFSRLLTSKGFKREVIDAALEPLDYCQQIESATRLKQRLKGRYTGKPAREAKAKLSQALSRRGFAWDIISQVMDSETWDSEE
jgi:regulatory protein